MRPRIPYPSSTNFRVFTSSLLSFLLLMSPMAGPVGALAAPASPPASRAAEADAAKPAGLEAREPSAPALAPVFVAPVTAQLTDNITPNTTKVDKGSTINYTATITNTSGGTINGVEFQDTPDANTTLVGGSIHASPVAVNDSYSTVGNTLLEVGVAASGAPSVTSSTKLFANDTAPTDSIQLQSFQSSSANGGTVSVNSDGSFTYLPPVGFTGSDTFTYTIRNSADNSLQDTATVTITVSSRVWYVNNAVSNGDGRSTSPFNSLTPVNGAGGNGDSDAAGDIIYVFTGNANYTTGLVMENTEALVGNGVALVVNSTTLRAAGTRPTLATNPITLASANTLTGFNMSNNGTSAAAINGTSVGTLAVSNVAISTTGGGLDLTGSGNPSVNVVLDSLTSSGGTNNVKLVSLGGTVNLGSSGALSGATGDSLVVGSGSASSGGAATISFSGTIGSGSAHSVNVNNMTGGSVSLSGKVTDTDTGITLASNTGATINFSGGLDLQTTSNTAFNATGGGTINVTGTNTISTGTGKAVNAANVTFGASGATFQSISANGGTNGITLDTTSGNFTVAGDGTGHANGSGGNIQNITIVTVGDITADAVYMKNVSGTITLKSINVSLNGTNTNTSGYAGMYVDNNNTAGTSSFNVTGCTFTGRATSAGANNTQNKALLQIESGSTAHVTGNVQDCFFNGGRTYGFEAQGVGTSVMNVTVNQSGFGTEVNSGAATNNPGSTITNPPAIGMLVQNGGSALVDYTYSNNTLWGFDGNNGAIYVVGASGAGTNAGSHLNGTVSGNKIGKTGVTGSGCLHGCTGIGILPGLHGTANVTITNNDVRQVNADGAIHFEDTIGAGADFSSIVTIQGNTVAEPVTVDANNNPVLFLRGILVSPVNSGGSSTTVCAQIGGAGALANNISGNWNQNGTPSDIRVTNNGNTIAMKLPGYGGAATDTTAVNAFLSAQNNNVPVTSNAGTQGFVGGASCPLFLGLGGVTPSSSRLFTYFDTLDLAQALADGDAPAAPSNNNFSAAPSATSLTQQQLDSIVAAAIQRWAATGLTDEQVASLRAVNFEITDLSNAYLGEAEGGRVLIDRDAEGRGWFVDPNPLSDQSFAHPLSTTLLYADPSGAPAGHVDLLTAIEHELGHHLRLADTYSAAERDNLMYGYLTVGERRLPARGQAAHADAGAPAGPHFLSLSGDAPRQATINRAAPSRRARANAERKSEGVTLKSAPAAAATLFTAPPVDVVFGTLTAGKVMKVKFSVTVNNSLSPANTTQVQTQGSVLVTGFPATPTDDPDTGATGDATVTLISRKDLALTSVTDNNTTTTPGSTLTYVITYSNPGHAATGVVITETVPTGTTFNSGSSSAGWTCTPDNNAGSTCTNTIGALAAGAGNATINFAVTVNNPAASHLTSISDTASIDDDHAYEADFDTSNNSASDSTTLNAEPAFGTFTKDDGTTSTTPGSTLTYTINYANTGNQDAVGVVLTETVPAGTTYVATGSSAWSCADASPAGTTCTINVGALAGGGGSGSATFKVTVLSPAAAGLANIVNNASIADDGSNTTGSSTPKAASAQDSDTLNAAPDLSVTKTPDVSIAGPGQTITYTVNYANNGNQAATGVKVTETVPANTTFVATGSSAWTGCADGAVAGTVCTNTVGALAAGGNGSLTFKVKINNSIPGGTTQITNTATIDDDHANGTDPNTGDNTTGNVNTTLCQSTVTVTNTNDSGAGSLRDAVSTVCPNGTINFQIPTGDAHHSGGAYTITLTSGELALSKNLTINGPNSGDDTDAIVVSGNDASRVFNVAQNLTVSISKLTATHGNATGNGGAILNNEGSKLTLTGVTVSNSTASDGGGGIANICNSASPTLILEGSTVSGNTATGDLGGGGIYTECSGTLYVDNSAIDGNHSTGTGGPAYGGGGISVNAGAKLSVSNSTISNNTASKNAGGIYAASSTASQITLINSTLSGNSTNGNGGALYGRATMVNTTVTNNRADADGDNNGTGGGLYINTLTVSLLNSIVAGNFHGTGSTSDDIDTTGGGSATGSFNLIGTGGSGGLTDGTNGNQVGVADAKLGALANNGGPTKTHSLQAGSPAIDAGTDVTTLSAGIDNSTTSVAVADATAIPDAVNFRIQVDSEQMTVTAKSGNTLTVVRGANSTTAASHTNGTAVNPAFDQRGTPFSRKTEGKANSTVTVDIGAYEVQPPTASGDSYSTDEDTPLSVSAANGVLANDSGSGTKTAAVTTPPSHASSFNLNADGSFDYTPAQDYNGPDSFTYTVTDSGGGSAQATASITVNAVNDPVTASAPATATVNEDTPTAVTGLSISDVDATLAPSGVYEVTLSATNGTLTLTTITGLTFTAGDGTADTSMTFHGTLSDINTALATASYTPNTNYNGSAQVSISVTDTFNSVVATGTGAATSDNKSVSVTVVAVNDAPTTSNNSVTTLEDTAYTFQTSDFPFADTADSPSANALANVIITSLPASGTLKNNGAAISTVPTAVSATDVAAGKLTFAPAADGNGTPYTTFQFEVEDDGGTANGGADTSAAATMTVNVTAVNDAPSFTKGADQTVGEDAGAQTVNNWATGISAGPSDENGQTLTFNVTNNTNTALFSVQPAVSSSGTLTYTPASNANGSADITLTLSDNGGTANNGSDTSQPQTFKITVDAVADTPSVTNSSTNEDTQTTTGLVISRNAADGSEVTNFKITNIQHGTLFKNDGTTQINGGDFITFAEGNAGLKFTPATDFNDSMGTASFDVQASTSNTDAGLGGSAVTATISVTAVNDAPVFTKGPNQSVPLNAGPQSVSNWATNIAPGPATATDETGQTVNFIVTNDNNGLFSQQPAVSSSGTLTYTPAANTSGQATVSVSLHDNGGTANSGSDTSAVQTFTITVGMPSLTAHDAQAAEPSTGTAKMIFTVTMSSALASQTVTVNYATADGTATAGTCGNSGADYQSASGTLTFSPGDTVKTVEVTICADGDANSASASETLTLNLSGASGATIAGTQATGTITHTNAPGTFIISEIRTSGPGGAGDDFVELYNNTDSPLTVQASDASGGYGVFKMGATCADAPVLVAQIPNGTVIPARGHYLLVGSAYSLSAYAAGDQTMTSDIENDRNVAVFTTSDASNLSTVTRLDAVGFGTNVDAAPVTSDAVVPGKHPQAAISTDTPVPAGGVCDLFREGTNLPAAGGSTLEYSFFRDECAIQPNQGCTAQGNPKDTNDNSADFLFADTQGTGTSMGQRLGAPGPENKTSPIRRDSTISIQLLDSSVSSSANINRFRDPTPNTPNANTAAFGTLSLRRRVQNNTGGDVTRLRFRIIEVTTFPNAAGNADLRAITSSDASVSNVHDTTTCVDRTGGTASNCTVLVKGTLLEQPPTQTSKGGGYNSSLSVNLSGLSGGKLANGQSVEVQLQLGVMQPGSFRILVIIEALP